MHSQEVAEPGANRLKIITRSIYGAPPVPGEVDLERRGSLSWVLESPERCSPGRHEGRGGSSWVNSRGKGRRGEGLAGGSLGLEAKGWLGEDAGEEA